MAIALFSVSICNNTPRRGGGGRKGEMNFRPGVGRAKRNTPGGGKGESSLGGALSGKRGRGRKGESRESKSTERGRKGERPGVGRAKLRTLDALISWK